MHVGPQMCAGHEQKLLSVWKKTDELFGILRPEAILARPIVWRHPFIFYVGHLPAFAWNQICQGMLKWPSLNPRFDDVFARGIDPDVDTGQCHGHPEVPDDWPRLDETLFYRDRVRETVLNSLDDVPRAATSDPMARNGRIFRMVIEHEMMHQETLLYMIHELSPELKLKPAGLAYSFEPPHPREEIEIRPGLATLGASFLEIDFGWDNEFPRNIVPVAGFIMDSTPATNTEFFEFMDAGGYERRENWTEADWCWKKELGLRHPRFWLECQDEWLCRTPFDLIPLEQAGSWPVYVSLAEAKAYARWRGKRLPTEAEFHRAAFGNSHGTEEFYPWGEEPPSPEYGNFDFRHWSPLPVGATPKGASAWGIHELVGNGWEWTETPFVPFAGFRPYPNYPEYSADFFDGKHYVLKGASWATPADLLRPSFRNWFQAHYPYVFAKFRCVRDL